MFTGVTFEQAMKYHLQGKEVIVIDRNSVRPDGKVFDIFPFEELFEGIEFIADVPAVENPEWNEHVAEMVAGNHPDIGEVTVILDEESCGANATKGQDKDTAEPTNCECAEIRTPTEPKKTKKSIILELTEQGKTAKEIAEITGFAIQTIHQTRYLSKRGTKENNSQEIQAKPPKEVVPGHNADRHLCKICKWRGKKNNPNGVGCEFAQYHDHTRGCAVEDCDVFEKGNPAKQKKPIVLS